MKQNVFFRTISLFLLLSLSITSNLLAETLILKNGRKVEGSIIKKTSDYIKLEVKGVPLTYWREDIKNINHDRNNFNLKPSPQADKNFLWQIQSPTGEVYLLGSIHLAKPEMYPLDERIEKAYKNSDILVVEVNTNKFSDYTLQKKFLDKGTYSSGQALRSGLSTQTYNLLEEKLNDLGVGIGQVDHLKPWVLALKLTVMELVKLGFNPEDGIDQYFLNKAKGTKEIAELESLDYQINLLNSFSNKMQDKLLFSTLIDLNIVEEEMANIISAWKRGEADKLNQILFAEFDRYPELQPVYYKLFNERNKKMVSKIENYLKDQNIYFIVVGAGHLVGEEGIINLLEEKGYSANQL